MGMWFKVMGVPCLNCTSWITLLHVLPHNRFQGWPLLSLFGVTSPLSLAPKPPLNVILTTLIHSPKLDHILLYSQFSGRLEESVKLNRKKLRWYFANCYCKATTVVYGILNCLCVFHEKLLYVKTHPIICVF